LNKKQIGINVIMQVFAFLLGLGITFFLTPYIIAKLGVDAYGFFPMANTMVSYATIITVAVGSMSARFVAVAYHEGNLDKAKIYFSTTHYVNIVIAIFLSIISLIVVIFLDRLINIPKELVTPVKFLFAFVFFSSNFVYALSAYKISTFVKNRIEIDAYINIIKSIMRVIVLLLLFSFFKPNIAFVGLASAVIFIFEAVSYIRIKNKLIPDIQVDAHYYRPSVLKELIRPGVWNSLGQINTIIIIGLDLIIANLLLGSERSGVLAVAKNIPSYAYGLSSIIAVSFTPSLTKAYAKSQDSLYDNLKQSFLMLIVFGSLIIGGVLVLGDIFYRLWIPDLDSTELQILTILTMLPLALSYGVLTFSSVFIIQNKVKLNALMNFGVALLSVATTITLVKYTHLGLYAIAGVSSVYVIILQMVFSMPYVSKLLNKKWYTLYPEVFKSIASVAVVALVGFGARQLIAVDSWSMFLVCALLTAAVSLFINIMLFLSAESKRALWAKLKTRFSNN